MARGALVVETLTGEIEIQLKRRFVELTGKGSEIEALLISDGILQVGGGFVEAGEEVLLLHYVGGEVEGGGGEDRVSGDDLLIVFVGTLNSNGPPGGKKGVVEDMNPSREVIMREDVQASTAAAIQKEIVVEGDIAFALEEIFGAMFILEEEIVMNQVLVLAAGAFDGEVADQEIGTGAAHAGGDEAVVSDDCRLGLLGHSRIVAPVLLLDLNPIACGVGDEVVFDQPAHEGVISTMASEIHPGAGVADFDITNRPIPGGSAIGSVDSDSGRVIVDDEVFQGDMVGGLARLDGVADVGGGSIEA